MHVRFLLLGLILLNNISFAQIVRNVDAGTKDSFIYTFINGKRTPAFLYFDDGPNYRCYEIKEPFTENNTNFIWRLICLSKCDTCGQTDTCVTNYYISSRNQKDHLEHALKIAPKHFYEEDGSIDSFYLPEFLKTYPNVVHHNINGLPRMWLPIMKYHGQYYFSADNPYIEEFSDSTVMCYGQEFAILPYQYYYFDKTDSFYCYETVNDITGSFQTIIQPSPKVKGLYVANVHSESTGKKWQSLVTTLEYIDHFDLIDIAGRCDITDLEYDDIDYADLLENKQILRVIHTHTHRYDFKKREPEIEAELNTSEFPITIVEDVLFVSDNSMEDSSDIFRFTEEMPEYPGGSKALTTYINGVIQYPEIALNNSIEGTVLVEFIVEKDGSLSNVKVEIPLFPECDKEAVRVIRSMPKWKPAQKNGKPVRCYFKVPVSFRLNNYNGSR